MPLSAGSSSQVPCGLDLSTPNSLPHTPVRHPSSHDTPVCPDFIRRIRENTQRVRGVWGEEQSLGEGSDEKAEAGGMTCMTSLKARTIPTRGLHTLSDNPEVHGGWERNGGR